MPCMLFVFFSSFSDITVFQFICTFSYLSTNVSKRRMLKKTSFCLDKHLRVLILFVVLSLFYSLVPISHFSKTKRTSIAVCVKCIQFWFEKFSILFYSATAVVKNDNDNSLYCILSFQTISLTNVHRVQFK